MIELTVVGTDLLHKSSRKDELAPTIGYLHAVGLGCPEDGSDTLVPTFSTFEDREAVFMKRKRPAFGSRRSESSHSLHILISCINLPAFRSAAVGSFHGPK